MNKQLHIRCAQHQDIEGLLDLYRYLSSDEDRCSLGDAAAILDKVMIIAGSAVFIGIVDEQHVTTCTLMVIPNLTRGGRSYALIENVVTHAAYRQRGYGKMILHSAIERAWNENCYKVMLMTGSKQSSTLAFYEAAGFEQTKTGFQIRRPPARVYERSSSLGNSRF